MMIRKIIFTAALFLSALTINAQSNINSVYNGIKEITVEGKIVLNIYKGEETTVKGTVKNELMNLLEWKTKNNELTIKLKEPFSFKRETQDSVVLNLYIKDFEAISAANKAEVYFGEKFSFEHPFNISTSSKGNVSAIVNAKQLNIEASSSSKTLVSGSAENIVIKSSSSAYVNTIQTETVSVEATATSNSECYVRATKLLKLKANTSANIFYKGSAEEIDKTTATFGKIEKF